MLSPPRCMLSPPRCILSGSRMHHRFVSDVERTGAGIILSEPTLPPNGGTLPETDGGGGWGVGPRGWRVRPFFAFSLLGIDGVGWWVRCRVYATIPRLRTLEEREVAVYLPFRHGGVVGPPLPQFQIDEGVLELRAHDLT